MENYAQRVIASSGVCVQLLRWDLSSGFYQDFFLNYYLPLQFLEDDAKF